MNSLRRRFRLKFVGETTVYWAGRSRKAVFILGAGATRGAVPHVVVNRKRIKSPLNGDFFKVVENFARACSDGQNA